IDSDAIGTVTFRNAGTATLNGVLVSDADWIEPPPELIEIPPGEFRNINFTVRRSRRPDAATGGGGTLFATLRLVYLDGGALGSKTRLANTGSGVNVSVVTVVDTSKPAVESSPIPAPGANEIIRFIPGAIASETKFTDIYLTNSFGSASLSDLRLFFRPAGGGTASVATPASIAPNQSLAFGSIVASVFESASVGTLMIRTGQPESLLLTATLSAAGSVAGPASGAMPVFRSDRAIRPGDRLYLAGIPTAGPYQKILYLQEVSGGEASAIIEAYDAGGNPVGTAQSISSIGGFALVQLTTLSPSAASLIITNGAGSSGALVGWVQIEDTATGDHWGIVDWSRFHGFDPSAAQRVPLVIREGETSSGRRRPARRSGVGGSASVEDRAETSPPQSTAMALFNPGSTNAVVRLGQWESGVEHEKSVTLGPKQTLVIDDVVRFVRGGSGRSVSSLVVTPLSGSVVTTARLTEAAVGGGQVGAGIPVLAAGSGFRLGQSKLFAGLEDSTRETMTAAIGGTSRTSFGMVEVAGSAVTVRATLLFYSGGAIAGTSISRDFQVGPRSVVLVDEMARAIFGSARESLFGDMKNLQLELRVVEGSGAVNFFVLSTDNGSNDPVLQF
ncbi:MAG TPA: hypothetical protein VM534_08090, partial [Thermoanaerobaculia bacterium]|nr:hypothetical protein [Thermoanaerobaculia bacterium]